ncbi:peptide ligase PGM1-related protein [Streptomyces sp. NPDC006208]|uniref:preATP grasp domain-containing protein n=1 Tax=Streptomyces sp. NPDC006208 TaxID=3156734 RepID=UPI0033A18B24
MSHTCAQSRRILLVNLDVAFPRAVYRLLWMLREHDVVVTACPVEEEFLAYVCGILGVNRDTITLVVHDTLLTGEELTSPRLARAVQDALAPGHASADYFLEPCMLTEGVSRLSSSLGIPLGNMLRFGSEYGSDLLNRKSHFRQLAVGVGLPVPVGSIVHDADALARALRESLPATGTVIVKRDNDRGGRGNAAVTIKDIDCVAGTFVTHRAAADPDLQAKALWEELTGSVKTALVVEEYHDHEVSFYLEFLIHDDGSFTFVDSGTVDRRRRGEPPAMEWIGLHLPARLPGNELVEATLHCSKLVELCARIGYRGYINVDGIVTPDGRMFYNEVNARLGGGLSLHLIGCALLGDGFSSRHYLMSLRDVPPRDFVVLRQILADSGLGFSPATEEGIVVVGYDPTLERTTECLLLAADPDAAKRLERDFRVVLGQKG